MREVVFYVNVKSGKAHADRECDFLIRVPDKSIRLAHHNSSSLPPLSLCRRCVPMRLDLSLMDPAPELVGAESS